MSWLITNALSAFLLPPLNLLLIALLGLWFWRRQPRLALRLISLAVIVLWLLSTPIFAEFLLQQLEGKPVVVAVENSPADAIVVLGGGTYFAAPEYDGDTVSAASLQRLRYAAKLYRATGKPLLVTGGKPFGNEKSEAAQMKSVLEQEFNVPVRWVEDTSDNTLENARHSFLLLQATGIRRIYLVTHAWHMPRSQHAFAAAGLTVVAAPTAFTTRYQIDLMAFLPSATALRDSKIFLHEIIGMAWYWLRN